MKFILGKKIAMSQQFKADGQVVPVTIVKAGSCFISQVKSDKDGYQAVQVGFESKKKLNKPLKGHLKNLTQARYLREFRVEGDQADYKIGQQITAGVFAPGDKADVTATSKGKGFQGVVKRHHFAGAPKTHGDKDQLRHGGSIGAQRPQRVIKNKRMAGRMGNDQVTVKNLEIIAVDDKNELLYIKGAVPGCRNALVKIVAPGEMKLTQAAEQAVAEVKTEVNKEEIEAETPKAEELVAPEKETVSAEIK
jgi:large subunit ribosomal protein L3